jgi:hypothetical protein
MLPWGRSSQTMRRRSLHLVSCHERPSLKKLSRTATQAWSPKPSSLRMPSGWGLFSGPLEDQALNWNREKTTLFTQRGRVIGDFFEKLLCCKIEIWGYSKVYFFPSQLGLLRWLLKGPKFYADFQCTKRPYLAKPPKKLRSKKKLLLQILNVLSLPSLLGLTLLWSIGNISFYTNYNYL